MIFFRSICVLSQSRFNKILKKYPFENFVARPHSKQQQLKQTKNKVN
jgi:hypothetical protein